MRERLTGPKLGQILVVLVILAGAFFYKTYKNDNSSHTLDSPKLEMCDVSHSLCSVEQGGLLVEARLTSQNLQPEAPFNLSLTLSDSKAKVLKSRLEGHTMYMGTLPALLKETAPGHWQGQAMVGSCTERSMIWAWVLEIETAGETQQVKFLFEVTR